MPLARGRAIDRLPKWELILLLSLLLGFASISTDLYLPALPSMRASLNADQGLLELTISAYLLGFGLGQLFWGPLSDRYGRRVPLMLGIAIFTLGAIGCALANDAWQLIAFRLVQAAGASAAVVLARAIVRDLFDATESARMLSTLMVIMTVVPLLGPSLGAQILAISSWRAIFWSLVAVGVVTTIWIGRAPESLPLAAREGHSLGAAFAAYLHHLRNARLLAFTAALGGFSAGVFAYVAGSSFVYISYFGLAPSAYGLVFAAGIIGITSANTVNRQLVPRLGGHRLLLIGTTMAAAAGLVLCLTAWTGWGGIVAYSAALFVFVAMNGLVSANAVAGGLASVDRSTGSASALLGFAQYGGGMLGAALVAAFADGTPRPMAAIILAGSVVATLSALALRSFTKVSVSPPADRVTPTRAG